jgi:hypothetical protein
MSSFSDDCEDVIFQIERHDNKPSWFLDYHHYQGLYWCVKSIGALRTELEERMDTIDAQITEMDEAQVAFDIKQANEAVDGYSEETYTKVIQDYLFKKHELVFVGTRIRPHPRNLIVSRKKLSDEAEQELRNVFFKSKLVLFHLHPYTLE